MTKGGDEMQYGSTFETGVRAANAPEGGSQLIPANTEEKKEDPDGP